MKMEDYKKGGQSPIFGTDKINFIHLANHRHENLFNVPIMIGG